MILLATTATAVTAVAVLAPGLLLCIYNAEDETPGALKLKYRLQNGLARLRQRLFGKRHRVSCPSPAERHNMTKSPIHQLPHELILPIVQQLSGPEALAARATCRRFFYLSPPDPGSSTTRDEQFGFHLLRLRDRFHHLCQADRAGVLAGAACSYCRTTHPRRYFSADQLLNDPDHRRCFGATARVPLCPHKSLSHETLLGLGNGGPLCSCRTCGATATVKLPPCSCGCEEELEPTWDSSFRSLLGLPLDIDDPCEIPSEPLWAKECYAVLQRTLFSLTVPSGETLNRKSLAAAIVGHAPEEQLCPHLSTESVADRFPECWLGPIGTVLCAGGVGPDKKRCTGRLYCGACSSVTSVVLKREESGKEQGFDIVSLQTKRSPIFTTRSGAVTMAWLKLCDAKFARE